MKTSFYRALLANENCTCENNGDYCESCQEIIERFEQPVPFEILGRTYAYSVALRVANDLNSAFSSEGYTFHPTPETESRIFSRIHVYGPSGTFLGIY